MKKAIFSVCYFLSFCLFATPPSSFEQAKKIALTLFSEHKYTLYCQCTYRDDKKIDLPSCGMQSATKFSRAKQIEWEHIVPASYFYHTLSCWHKDICKKSNGKKYHGRECCRKKSHNFKVAEAELYNLWPADGLINQLRANYYYDAFPYGEPSYGCNFIVDRENGRIEPGEKAKGIVARASLFIHDKYKTPLPTKIKSLYQEWDKIYPPTVWELSWAKKVAAIEGYENPYIKHHIG